MVEKNMWCLFIVTLFIMSVDSISGKQVRSIPMADENDFIRKIFESRNRRPTDMDYTAARDLFYGALRKAPPTSQIVGGSEARPNSIPFIVSLQQYGSHFCGGTLIRSGSSSASDIVVTAAHCVYDGISGATASAGAHDLNRPSTSQQTVRISRTVYHPQYDPDSTMNDIAILKLEKPIKFTSTVQPVNLPAQGEVLSQGTMMTVAGWGLTREGGYDTSSLLMQVSVPIVATKDCMPSYATQGIQINDNAMICAGYPQGGKDSCQGDSGGPLFISRNNQLTIYGIVSFGVGCARAGLPGVYTRVSSYVGWIQSQTKALTSAP